MIEDVPAVTRLRRGEPLAVEGQEPLFRRRPVTPTRRRPRRLRSIVLGLVKGLVVLAPPLALTVWALSSPVFALQEFEIDGAERVERSWLLARLEPLMGNNLLTLRLQAVEGGLVDHAWVQSVRLRKDLPSRLLVEIVEYRPSAVVTTAERRYWAAADGQIIAPVDVEEPDLLDLELAPQAFVAAPQVGSRSRTVEAALVTAGEMLVLGEAWGRRLEAIVVLGPEDYELRFADTEWSARIRPGDLEARWTFFERLLPRLEERYDRFDTVDLRFSRRVVLQGAENDRPSLPEVAAQDGKPEISATDRPL